MTHTVTVLDIKGVSQGQWPEKWTKFYFTWWIGPLSKFVGVQVWRFRLNLHYDHWGKKKWGDYEST